MTSSQWTSAKDPLVDALAEEIRKAYFKPRLGAWLEVEVRLGLLVDLKAPKSTVAKSNLPPPTPRAPALRKYLSETLLVDDAPFRFVSQISHSAFLRLRDYLETSMTSQDPFKIIHTERTYTVDKTCKIDESRILRRTLRVHPEFLTEDAAHLICKEKVSNLNVYSGFSTSSGLDFRISVNWESTGPNVDRLYDEQVETSHSRVFTPFNSRKKDRLTFWMPPFKIELTMVRNRLAETKKFFEVEIELDGAAIMAECGLDLEGAPNGFYQILQDYLCLARTLSQYLSDQWINAKTDEEILTQEFGSPTQVLSRLETMNAVSPPEIEAYILVFGPVRPLIGSYLDTIAQNRMVSSTAQ